MSHHLENAEVQQSLISRVISCVTLCEPTGVGVRQPDLNGSTLYGFFWFLKAVTDLNILILETTGCIYSNLKAGFSTFGVLVFDNKQNPIIELQEPRNESAVFHPWFPRLEVDGFLVRCQNKVCV